MNFKQAWSDLREQWRMFRELWNTVQPDCRGPLVGELFFNPAALRRRYDGEQALQTNLARRWQGIEEDE